MTDYDPTITIKPSVSVGKIIKGTINDADFKVSSSSIPSKFQTLITRSQTISAFGSGVNRFRNRNNAESPGPGAYSSRNRQSPSLSKKGYGPFVSKVDRSITINKMKSVPGPGAYKTPTSKQQATKFGKDEKQSQFVKQAARYMKYPGPGAYQNVKMRSHSSMYTSIFKKNLSKNFEFITQGPTPTTYRPKINTFDGRSFSIKKPTNIIKKENVFNSYFGAEKQTIGPGSYSPNEIQPHHGFKIKDSTIDRFGRVREEYKNSKKQNLIVPGPGTYNTPGLQKSAKKLKSMFISKTERKVFEDQKEGPLFYAYQSQRKKDFHTNPQQKWI